MMPEVKTSWAVSALLLGAKGPHKHDKDPKTIVSGFPLSWALEPACRILMFMWTFRPLALLDRNL